MPQDTPLISIIVAVYNARATLQQCIDSVARQSYAGRELIVIDGGSSDGSAELIEANRGVLAYHVSEPDRGITHAWNKGLARARGDWIAFLGADDYLWDERVLERLAAELANLPDEVRVAYGSITRFGDDGGVLRRDGAPWPAIRDRFRQFMLIPHPATLHRRSLFERHGRYDESFRIAADYEMLRRELGAGGSAVFIPDLVVAGVRAGGISTQPANALAALGELRRAQRKHGQRWPGRELLMETAKARVRLALGSWYDAPALRALANLRRRLRGRPPR